MSAADLEKQRALYEAWWDKHHADTIRQGKDGSAWELWQAAVAAQAESSIDKSQVKRMATQMGWTPPANESDGAMYARVSAAVSPELTAAAQEEINAALDRADAEDATRYRWLREKRTIKQDDLNVPWCVALDPAIRVPTSTLRTGIDLDHAIDAARKEKP